MNISRSKTVFAVLVAAGVLLGGQWASAGNLPKWGGATTTTQPQPVQQPRQPLVSAPAPIQTQTVQPTQPRTWTTQGTTSGTGSGTTVITPTQQPRSFQPKARSRFNRSPSIKAPPPISTQPQQPVQATVVQQPIRTQPYTMQIAPAVWHYMADREGRVSGPDNLSIRLQANTPLCQGKRVRSVSFGYLILVDGHPRTGVWHTMPELDANFEGEQQCVLDIDTSWNIPPYFGGMGCNTKGDPRFQTLTGITLKATIVFSGTRNTETEIPVTTYNSYGPHTHMMPITVSDAVSWKDAVASRIPVNFNCESVTPNQGQ